MALADFTALLNAMQYPSQYANVVKQLTTASASNDHVCQSMWRATGSPGAGAVPTTAATCDRTLAGALPVVNASAGELRAWLRRVSWSGNASTTRWAIQIVDRLAHMGGLDATLTTPQTVGLSLPARASGDRVMAAIEVYTTIGSTATTVTLSYTNQSGTAGQVTQPVTVGGAARATAAKLINASLAAGDTGVQAVATATLAASTLTAGNFGVTLFKPVTPILPLDLFARTMDPVQNFGGYTGLVPADACLMFVLWATGSTANVTLGAELCAFED